MKTGFKLLRLATLVMASTLYQSSTTLAQGTAFTYQGQLQNDGALANGTFNLTFTLFATNVTGTAVAGPITNNGIIVSNGLFTVTIDFGGAVWNGETNWLEIAAETNGGSPFTTLSPRQRVTPAPYAITAENLDGTVGSNGLLGTYGSMVTMNNPGNQFTGGFTGNGAGLTNVNAAALGGLGASNFWQLGGNTAASGSQIVGTLNNQPFDLYADGARGMRLVLRTDSSGLYSNAPNVIGGSAINGATGTGFVGVTIAGGGGNTITGAAAPNLVGANFGTIGGGFSNSISSGGTNAFIGGGSQNIASGISATVAGGNQNIATNGSAVVGGGAGNIAGGVLATVAGGNVNTASGFASTVAGGVSNTGGANYSTVAGGTENSVQGYGSFIGGGGFDGTTVSGNVINDVAAVIGGGLENNIPIGGEYAFIGGGVQNTASGPIATVAGGNLNVATNQFAFVGGGYDNTAGGPEATIAGGSGNVSTGNTSTIGGGTGNTTSGFLATVAGGAGNTAMSAGAFIGGGGYDGTTGAGNFVNANAATIGGGLGNHIPANSEYAFIGGGAYNTNHGYGSVIGGGGYDGVQYSPNTIQADAATIGGGVQNSISSGAGYSFIGGGAQNTASGGESTIAGGQGNVASANGSTVGGGVNNNVSGEYSTVPGGFQNKAGGTASFAAGNNAHATDNGSFVWSDDTATLTQDSAQNQFVARASGGFFFYTGTGSGGAQLDAGATSWTALSDRNAKKNFQPVDTVDVLNKLAAIPIEQWNYKWEKDNDTPNIGPMAQDFKAAFYPGRDDKGISTLEFDGVELAAIQGLNRKLNAKNAEIQQLKQQNESLEKRLDNLEKMIQSIAEKP